MRLIAIILLSAVTAQAAPDPRFVEVTPGTYKRGWDDGDTEHEFQRIHLFSVKPETRAETPPHNVKLTRPFAIATTEVTVGQFKAFVDDTGYVTTAEKNGGALGWFPDAEQLVDRFRKDPSITWRTPGFNQTDAHPVVAVSWTDAQAYCRWLGKQHGTIYRLPTEAEWEFACRAGTTGWYSWGKQPDDAYAHANVADGALEAAFPGTTRYQRAVKLGADEGDGTVFTAPVASFEPNPWGLFDMHGNVWEWCHDRWQADAYKALYGGKSRWEYRDIVFTDPVVEKETSQHEYGDWRSMRGGAWTCSPVNVRASIRTFAEAGDASVYTGFRIVRDGTP